MSPPGAPGQPGPAAPLLRAAAASHRAAGAAGQRPARPAQARPPARRAPTRCATPSAPGPIRSGSYYRYEFLRPLFPDYPRPAIWPDGYYVPTSTGDDDLTIATQKHACVAIARRCCKGEPATEQCVVIDDVNFLNNADVDGKALPPAGAPNIMMAAGGTQLRKHARRTTWIDVWQFHVDWKNPAKTADHGTGEDHRRAVPLPLRRAAHELRAAARHRPPARRAGRQDHVAPRVPTDRRPRVDRRRPLGQHVGRRRRRALVRVPDRPGPHASACTSRARTRPTASSAGWPARRSTRAATSASATRSAARRTSPVSASRRGWRTIRPAC